MKKRIENAQHRLQHRYKECQLNQITMRLSAIFFVFSFCIGIANAQRFDKHEVYLDNNGLGTCSVKVKPAISFTIKKDNRILWAKYKIGNGEVTFSALANTTSNKRSCDFILIDKNGNNVDTLVVIQAGKISSASGKKTSNAIGSASASRSKTTTTSTRKKTSSTQRGSYGGQCAATTKKGTRCSRKAASGSIYCWQHR